MIETLMNSYLVGAVGWSLVAFLWQGALAGAVVALLLRVLRRSDPRWRYGVACLGLLVMTALPVRTLVRGYAGTPHVVLTPAPTEEAPVPAAAPEQIILFQSAGQSANGNVSAPASDSLPWLQWVVTFWLAGVTFLTLRLAGGWALTFRMAGRGTPVGENLTRTIRRLARSLHVLQPVRARESELVDGPIVVGWLRPTILLPASAIIGLAPEQLEAVLAHELAHIRRHDYGINLLQRVVETLFFYHPVVWWLSNRIRAEREMCADDLAVTLSSDASVYASALRDLEAARKRPVLTVAATGGSLKTRIARLLGQPQTGESWSPVWAIVLLVSVFVVIGVGRPVGTTEAATSSQPLSPVEEAAIELPVPSVAVEAPVAAVQEAGAATEVEEVQVRNRDPESIVVAVVPEQNENGGAVVSVVPQVSVPTPAPVRVVSTQNVTPFIRTSSSWMGVTIADGDEQGALVQSVEDGSPADEAGIQEGDLITEMDGMRVVGARQLTRMIEETPAGRTISVTVVRDGEPRVLNVTLANQRPAAVFAWDGLNDLNDSYHAIIGDFNDFNYGFFPGGTLRLGLQVQEMTPELREFFGSDPEVGVLVTSVQEGSAAADAGILVGDVIVAAEGNPVSSRSDLTWSADLDDATVVLRIVRDRSERDVTVTLDLPPRSLRIAP